AILRAKELLSENSLELFAFELNLAIGELAKFTKDFDRNEILDEMFGNFCLGK
ncbi:TPA: tRNA uridine-5-carboxymethylaminomethyl(34) synthesis GTPase MnmE, partial [Campylobacter coli]|nr:tRNA uridine-5-carboxymethylaminomethyl(34) synthesis GTPase MnmE [Campylobacter coli]